MLGMCCIRVSLPRYYQSIGNSSSKCRRREPEEELDQPLHDPRLNWALWTKLGDGVAQRGRTTTRRDYDLIFPMVKRLVLMNWKRWKHWLIKLSRKMILFKELWCSSTKP